MDEEIRKLKARIDDLILDLDRLDKKSASGSQVESNIKAAYHSLGMCEYYLNQVLIANNLEN